MEEILRKLQKEASGSKYRAIKESCTWAIGKGPGRPRRSRAARGGAERGPARPGAARGGAGQEAPMERFCNGGGRETQQTCSALAAEPPAGGEAPVRLGRFRMPRSSALLERAMAPAGGPREHPCPSPPLPPGLLRGSFEADTGISSYQFLCVLGVCVCVCALSLKSTSPPPS